MLFTQEKFKVINMLITELQIAVNERSLLPSMTDMQGSEFNRTV